MPNQKNQRNQGTDRNQDAGREGMEQDELMNDKSSSSQKGARQNTSSSREGTDADRSQGRSGSETDHNRSGNRKS